MPPKRRRSEQGLCSHPALVLGLSPHGVRTGYSQPTTSKRQAAATPSGNLTKPARSKLKSKDEGRAKLSQLPLPSSFPAPLVLPEDELALDPKYPAQSLRSMIRDKDRNPVTPERKTIYVARPPTVAAGVSFLSSWIEPHARGSSSQAREATFSFDRLLGYLGAFFHGLPVKEYSGKLAFDHWTETGTAVHRASRSKKAPLPKFVALSGEATSTRIRVRRCPGDSPFSHQLNLNDLLDVAIDVLPEDAYALLLLVNHDIYEDDDDDFACGRAYGGSRIAVVSSARYDPCLDEIWQGLDRTHAWPASHCEMYLNLPSNLPGSAKVVTSNDPGKLLKPLAEDTPPMASPMELAIRAFDNQAQPSWLYRVSRTASHELCHCFGIDHCVYYACIMQGTASMAEDLRQPPSMCPVDLEKLRRAVNEGTGEEVGEDWTKKRYGLLLQFCERMRKEDKGRGGWASYQAWLDGILR